MPLTRPKAAQINFDITNISDPLLRFNSGQTGSNDKDAGFIVERGDDTNVGLVWDESADEFAVVSTTETGTTSGNITISAYANIRANAFYGDGSNLTNLPTGGDVLSDTSPQLGGDLDMNSNNITGTNVNIDIDGTGAVKVGNLHIGQNGYAVNEINTTSNGGSGPHIYVTTGTNGDFVVKNDSWMTGNTQFRAIYDDAVELYYNGSKKLETTNTGISITTTSTDDALLITSTEASSSASPVITLKRNSGSPADADYLGQIKFKGENDADQEIVYAKITGKIQDATDGTEDGMIEYAFKKGGSNNISARFRGDALQLLNGTNLYIGSTGLIQFEGSTADAYETNLTVAEPTADRTITLPDATGTVVLQDSADTLSNKTLASPTFSGTVSGDVTVSGYIKASKGIVQTVHNSTNVAASGNPINTWSEINSNYRVSITPRYSDSRILGTFHIPMNPTGATNILMAIQPWYSTNGGTTKTILAQGNTGVQGSRHNLAVSWFRSNNGFDVNDMQNHVVHFYHDPGTTSTVTYGWYFRSEGSNTTYFNHSNGNNSTWGWIAPQYLELRELRT